MSWNSPQAGPTVLGLITSLMQCPGRAPGGRRAFGRGSHGISGDSGLGGVACAIPSQCWELGEGATVLARGRLGGTAVLSARRSPGRIAGVLNTATNSIWIGVPLEWRCRCRRSRRPIQHRRSLARKRERRECAPMARVNERVAPHGLVRCALCSGIRADAVASLLWVGLGIWISGRACCVLGMPVPVASLTYRCKSRTLSCAGAPTKQAHNACTT